jgi:hypothetical protein
MGVEGAARLEFRAHWLRCRGCVLSDGRLAVLGGISDDAYTSSCEALMLGGDEH